MQTQAKKENWEYFLQGRMLPLKKKILHFIVCYLPCENLSSWIDFHFNGITICLYLDSEPIVHYKYILFCSTTTGNVCEILHLITCLISCMCALVNLRMYQSHHRAWSLYYEVWFEVGCKLHVGGHTRLDGFNDCKMCRLNDCKMCRMNDWRLNNHWIIKSMVVICFV